MRQKKYTQLLLGGLIFKRGEMMSAQKTHQFWMHVIIREGFNKGYIIALFKNWSWPEKSSTSIFEGLRTCLSTF